MNPADGLARLRAICPEFAGCWDAPDNLFREDDGNYTIYGLFSEFSRYFREHVASLDDSALAALGKFITESMEQPGTDIDNAVATCFLENLAGNESLAALQPFLGRTARDFLAQFD